MSPLPAGRCTVLIIGRAGQHEGLQCELADGHLRPHRFMAPDATLRWWPVELGSPPPWEDAIATPSNDPRWPESAFVNDAGSHDAVGPVEHLRPISEMLAAYRDTYPYASELSPRMTPRWVRQDDAGGCGAATLAMIAGCTYDEAKAQIDALPWVKHNETEAKLQPIDWSDGGGMSTYHLDRALYAHGFFKQTRYASWGHDLTVPFAVIHYAMVVQPSNNYHFVVMLHDGVILDPVREGTYRLADWPKVWQVCGLMRNDSAGARL